MIMCKRCGEELVCEGFLNDPQSPVTYRHMVSKVDRRGYETICPTQQGEAEPVVVN